MKRIFIASVAIGAAVLTPATAFAQAPANDSRSTPSPVSLPASIQGATDGATLEPEEPNRIQGTEVTASVWYEFTTASARRLVLRFRADGELDAAIEVYRRSRSQLLVEASALTNEQGEADLILDSRAGGSYLVRVAQRANSVAGTFRLDIFLPQPPPSPPGTPLPAGGASGSVDPLSNTSDAWSMSLRAGTTYRIYLANASDRRLGLAVFAPGTRSFVTDPAVRAGRTYFLFTPAAGQGGRYSFVVSATGFAGRQPYRLTVATAGSDDMWPGRLLRNHATVRASFRQAAVDRIDTYRFDLANRSAVTIDIRTAATNHYDLQLLTFGGKRVARLTAVAGVVELDRILKPGRYVVVVRARRRFSGTYRVRRVARAVTKLRMERTGRGLVEPGSAVGLQLRLTPRRSGFAVVTVERRDPLTGWHFVRTIRTRIRAGAARVAFTPSTIGKWRARAVFQRTRTAQRSQTRRDVTWTVAEPLEE